MQLWSIFITEESLILNSFDKPDLTVYGYKVFEHNEQHPTLSAITK